MAREIRPAGERRRRRLATDSRARRRRHRAEDAADASTERREEIEDGAGAYLVQVRLELEVLQSFLYERHERAGRELRPARDGRLRDVGLVPERVRRVREPGLLQVPVHEEVHFVAGDAHVRTVGWARRATDARGGECDPLGLIAGGNAILTRASR
eukprot:29892-Pelagococcus_subviridis.AAC.6